jgi:hypothetical protein
MLRITREREFETNNDPPRPLDHNGKKNVPPQNNREKDRAGSKKISQIWFQPPPRPSCFARRGRSLGWLFLSSSSIVVASYTTIGTAGRVVLNYMFTIDSFLLLLSSSYAFIRELI